MDRRVNVRAAVLRSAIPIGRVEITLGRAAVKLGFQGELLRRRPIERLGGEFVREINPLAAGERRLAGVQPADGGERNEPGRNSVKGGFHAGKVIDYRAGNNAPWTILDGLRPVEGGAPSGDAGEILQLMKFFLVPLSRVRPLIRRIIERTHSQ